MLATASCRCVKTFNIVLLDGRTLQIQVGAKATYYDVFEKACLSIGLTGTQVFGLAFQSADEAYYFVELLDVVSKPSSRLGRNLHLIDTGTLYLRVQYYVSNLGLLKDHTARHFYYLQLRENFVRYSYECTEERCFLMAAYALRADFGAYDADRHGSGYFEPSHYFPKWMIDKYGSTFIVKHMPSIHADLSHVRRDEAKHTYMLELCSDLPSSYNLHLYRLRRKRAEYEQLQQRHRSSCFVYLALSPNGLELFEPSRKDFISGVSSYPWWSIDKVTCEKQKLKLTFSQAAQHKKLELHASGADWSKHLLWLIRHVHLVQMGLQKQEADDKVATATSSSLPVEFNALSDRKKYRESYIHSDVADLEWEHEQALVGDRLRLSCGQQQQYAHSPADNRVSVISNGSSNTTSGVVSDKLHISFDESDGEEDQYCRGPCSKHLTKDQLACSSCPCQDERSCTQSSRRLMRKEPSADSVLAASQKVARYLSAASEHRGMVAGTKDDGRAVAATGLAFATSAGPGKAVQRATSDPNKPPPQADLPGGSCGGSCAGCIGGSVRHRRRTVSDDELITSSLSTHRRQASEHIYENIAVYRRLPASTAADRSCEFATSSGSDDDDPSPWGPTFMEGGCASGGCEPHTAQPAAAAASRSEDLSLLACAAWPTAAADGNGMNPQPVSDGRADLPPPPSYAAAQLQKHLRLLGSGSAAVTQIGAAIVPSPARAHGGGTAAAAAATYNRDRTNGGSALAAAPAAAASLGSRQQHQPQPQSSLLLRLLHSRQAAGMSPLTASTSTELMPNPSLSGLSQAIWKSSCHGGSHARSQDMYASAGVLDANQNFAMSRSVGDCRQVCPLHDHKKSHPDINKLRDMSHDMSLPLIAGLCNDKHLTASMEACSCAGLDDDARGLASRQLPRLPTAECGDGCASPRHKPRHHAADERPLSWHCGEARSSDLLLRPPAAATPAPRARPRAQTSITGVTVCSSGSVPAPPPVHRPAAVTRLMV